MYYMSSALIREGHLLVLFSLRAETYHLNHYKYLVCAP